MSFYWSSVWKSLRSADLSRRVTSTRTWTQSDALVGSGDVMNLREDATEIQTLWLQWICQNHIYIKMHNDVTSPCRKPAAVMPDLVQPDHHITFTSSAAAAVELHRGPTWFGRIHYDWYNVWVSHSAGLCASSVPDFASFTYSDITDWHPAHSGEKTPFTVCAWRVNYLRYPDAASCRILSVNCWVFPWCPCLVI